MLESIKQRIILMTKYPFIFIKQNQIPLKWKILFLKSLFWTKSRFCLKFYKILQEYNKGDYYNFNDLKVSFFPFKSNKKRSFVEYFVDAFLTIIYPFLYGSQYIHPLYYRESYYIDKKKMSINSKDTVLDCGGFIGHFSITASKMAYNGKVYVFEPFQENVNLLSKNVEQNNLKNVTLIQKAVSKKTGKTQLFFNKDLPCSSGKFLKVDSIESYDIHTVTIDDFFKENNLKRVDFIKMDIEGMERYALIGAKKVISMFKPKLSICTYHLKDDPILLPRIIKNIRKDYKIKNKIGKIFAY